MSSSRAARTGKRNVGGVMRKQNGTSAKLILKGEDAARIKRELIEYEIRVLGRSRAQARRSAEESVRVVNEVAADVCGH